MLKCFEKFDGFTPNRSPSFSLENYTYIFVGTQY